MTIIYIFFIKKNFKNIIISYILFNFFIIIIYIYIVIINYIFIKAYIIKEK